MGSETRLVIWHRDTAAISQAVAALAYLERVDFFSGQGSACYTGYGGWEGGASNQSSELSLFILPPHSFHLCLYSFQPSSVSVNLYFLHYCPHFPPNAIRTPQFAPPSPSFRHLHSRSSLQKPFNFFLNPWPPSCPAFHPYFYCFMCHLLSITHSFWVFSFLCQHPSVLLSLSLYCACSRLCDQSGGHVLSSDTLQCSVRLHKTLQSTFFFFLSNTDS